MIRAYLFSGREGREGKTEEKTNEKVACGEGEEGHVCLMEKEKLFLQLWAEVAD